MPADDGAAPYDLSCPFCCEPIRSGAVVCRHCSRDVSIPMPVLLAQREQRRELERLRGEVAELSLALEALRGEPRPGGLAVAPALPPALALPATLLAACLVSLALLLGAHWLLVMRYDAAVVVFRAACLGLPFTVAVLLPGMAHVPLGRVLPAALALGVVAVGLMSWVVARADGTPVVPTTRRDLLELLEFAGSIGLSFLAGWLVLRTAQRVRKGRHAARLGSVLRQADVKQVTERAALFNQFVEAMAPLAAMGGALLMGFRALLP